MLRHSIMFKFLISTAVALTTHGVMAGSSDLKKTLYYTLTKAGEFDVVYHRVDPAGAGGAIGGLLGAAIQTSHQASKDQEKQDQLNPHFTLANCGDAVMQAFTEKLKAKAYPASPLESSDSLEKGDVFLKISVDGCGFRLTDSVDGLMSAHVLGAMRLYQKGQTKPIFEERVFLTGKHQFTFTQLSSEPEEITDYVTEILEKAGKRIANKIIYR